MFHERQRALGRQISIVNYISKQGLDFDARMNGITARYGLPNNPDTHFSELVSKPRYRCRCHALVGRASMRALLYLVLTLSLQSVGPVPNSLVRQHLEMPAASIRIRLRRFFNFSANAV